MAGASTHSHSHSAPAPSLSARRLGWALTLTLAAALAQALGGWWAHSLALWSNAGHLLSDGMALALGFWAARVEDAPPTQRLSYGYHRSGIIAGFLNALLLGLIGATLVGEGAVHVLRPEAVDPGPVAALAAGAIGFGLLITWVLSPTAGRDLNVRALFLHAFWDTVGSAGIVLAALLVALTRWGGWDALAAAGIGLAVLHAAWSVGRDSLNILMEGVPAGLDPAAVRAAMREVEGVEEVHHLHLWALKPGFPALSAHVRVTAAALAADGGQAVLGRLQDLLDHRFGITHVTLQLEAGNGPDCAPCGGPTR
ncbi:MAG: cation diffusion facilitator family transporter [Firmicutes bacterium]|nr:cation diffusion facilitator family transporter [Bacillota bacterium]